MFGSPTERIQKQYAESKMGYLEDRIITKGNFQALPHLVLNMCQSGIVFPQKSGNIYTELVSNLHWDIKPAEYAEESPEGPEAHVEARNP